MQRIVDLFTSLKLTAVLLTLSMLLVFAGTIAQVEQGLYQAQARYFKSFFVYLTLSDSGLKIPVFPGGYLLGGLMLLNLLAATARRLRFTLADFGLLMIHAGLILLFVGQLATDVFSVESAMQLRVGETQNYSEDFHANELVLIDATDPQEDTVVSVPERVVARGGAVVVPGAPFTLQVRKYWVNAELSDKMVSGAEAVAATQGSGQGLFVLARGATTRMEERNLPAALLDVSAGGSSLGVWLVGSQLTEPQPIEHAGRRWQIALRPRRHYTPFSITLIDCQHDVYKGTEIPRNFSSRVRLQHPETGEDREVLIYMNNPLRYGGNTYYQYQMAARAPVKSSTLQVVRNPSWLTPYVSCILVGVGLTWQFVFHLLGFLRSRRHET